MSIEKKTKTLNESLRNYMLAHSASVTPDNPTQAGWSGSKIREFQWKPSDILFTYLNDVETKFIDYTNELVDGSNANASAISAEKSRAENAEYVLTNSISKEEETRKANDDALQANIDKEETRAKSEENTLSKKIDTTKSDIIGSTYDDKATDTINGAKAYSEYQRDLAKAYAKEYTDKSANTLNESISSNKSEIEALKTRASNDEIKIDTKMTESAYIGSDGKILASRLPSFVDDVLEYSSKSAFPSTAETGKIYVATDTNKQYRWSGSQYIQISESLAIGETQETAYSGYKGKQNREDIESLKTRTTAVEAKTTENATNIATKQDKLVSGTNIAKVNGNDLLKGGNIVIDVDKGTIDNSLSPTSTNAIQNTAVTLGFSAYDVPNGAYYSRHLEARENGLFLVLKKL